jgi:hypothetical protein
MKKTGFALLTPEQRREIALRGAASRKASGRTGHRWTPEEAKAQASAAGKVGATARRERGVPMPEGRPWTPEEAARANERRHDLAAQADPEVEWAEDAEPRAIR